MTQTTRLLAGAAAIAVLLVGGALLLRPTANHGVGSGVGGAPLATVSAGPTATASAAQSIAPSTVAPSSPVAVPALTQSFTSARHGYSVKYPAAWTVKAATAPWPLGVQAASPSNPMLDEFGDPGDSSREFVVVSQPLATGVTSETWLAAYEKSAPSMPGACWPAPAQMEKTRIGGRAAWIHGGLPSCDFTEAIAFAGGRVYELTGYVPVNAIFDRRLLNALWATVRFDPSVVDDSPEASPRPS